MNNWNEGYITDIDYTLGYYNELNPQRLRLALLYKGFYCGEINTACELGFGQGMTVNLHAAASTTKWYGNDFNPSHAGFAQQFGQISGANPQLFEQSFLEFCQRDDLPDFDFIGLHGIWSWISDENRQIIINFFKRKLKASGGGTSATTPNPAGLLCCHCEIYCYFIWI